MKSAKWPSIAKVLLFYILSIAIFACVSGISKSLQLADFINISITSTLTFFLVLLFAKWDNLRLTAIGINLKNPNLPRFLAGWGIGFLMVCIQVLIASSFAAIKFTLSDSVPIWTIFSSLALYFVIALREELVFRSYALRHLANSISPIFALVFITIVFILEHIIAGMSWKMAIIGSGFGGILFGLSALKTKGLALPLGLHFSWNFTQWLFGFKNNTGVWKESVAKGQEANAENIALTGFVIAMLIGISAVLLIYKKEKI